MIVQQHTRSWEVTNAEELAAVLSSRDHKGGALFFISPDGDQQYPLLAIRVTNECADVIFYPIDDHPGFRCLGGAGLAADGWTSFVYEGCDPGTGEETHNQFIIPFATACSIAKEFIHNGQKSTAVEWLEL